MRIEQNNPKRRRAASAFSMAETVVAVAVLGIVMASFFGGLSLSLSVVQTARETMRATQIMTERMDTIRLFTWDQINNTNFTAPFNPTATISNVLGSGQQGLIYTGQVTVAAAPIANGESYTATVKQVTITLNWRSKNMNHQTLMKTFVSQYGMQNYIY